MYTYFIIDEDREVVKIGRSKDPYQRLRTLSVASASRLKLLLVLVGNREKELHQRFAAYRVRSDREWFHTHQDIWNFIRLHKVGDSVCVPLAFYDWMKMQPYRDTPVGDFIGDALGDSSFPKDGSYSEIQWHLRTRSACRAARIACAKAYREFRHHWMRINPGKSLDAAFCIGQGYEVVTRLGQ